MLYRSIGLACLVGLTALARGEATQLSRGGIRAVVSDRGFFEYEWVNPRPDTAIEGVTMTLKPNSGAATVALLALTAVE